jgi:uncharacterized protein YcbK (DUF882 family)
MARRVSTWCASGVIALSLLGIGLRPGAARDLTAPLHTKPTVVMAVRPNVILERLIADSLLGRSGKLRARFVVGPLAASFPGIDPRTGASPGIVQVLIPAQKSRFSFITQVPFRQKFGDRVGTYVVGYWPGELRRVSTDGYENPTGFIEVDQENEMTRVSEHFVLRDFVTHDRQRAWPRYVVLQEALLDKLELVISDLEQRGVLVNYVRVMSGFRTPYHNMHGLGSEGGARDSRHQYGDAADVIIDNNRDGRMDDLNRDRRLDIRDLEIVLQAVERVERTYPELVGGLGKYHAIGPSGPFAHIDVRGYRARWNNEVTRTAVAATNNGTQGPPTNIVRPGQATRLSRCNASPEFARLCGGDSPR